MNNTPEALIEAVKDMGFEQVEGKGEGVLERHVRKRGEIHHLVVLASQRDASMLVNPRTKYAFKFQFKRCYKRGVEFIREYLETCQ